MFNSNQAFLLINPKGFTLGSKVEIEKKSFQSTHELLINVELFGLTNYHDKCKECTNLGNYFKLLL